ncbi:MAG: hypothetical protein CMN28_12630 [Salinisphaeraceae bacterium]|nr:hypothetical protein [Salinisphaeraceae bacterium]
MTTHLIFMAAVPAVVLVLVLLFLFLKWETPAVSLTAVAIPAVPMFWLAYTYHYIWSTASAAQQSELASMVANCPHTREEVKLVVAGGISMGEAETLIFECAEEHLRISSAAASP